MRLVAIGHRVPVQRDHVLRHLRDHNHIALKGQALIEKSLGKIISQHCCAASVLDGVNIPFHLKAKLARALTGDSHGTALWDLVWRLYLIRTEIACRTESPGVKRSIREFISEECRWAQAAMPNISHDSDLAYRFACSIESLLDVLAAIEKKGETTSVNSGPES